MKKADEAVSLLAEIDAGTQEAESVDNILELISAGDETHSVPLVVAPARIDGVLIGRFAGLGGGGEPLVEFTGGNQLSSADNARSL